MDQNDLLQVVSSLQKDIYSLLLFIDIICIGCFIHYENTSMLYTENFLVVKMKNFTEKILIFFLFLLKT